MENAIIAASNLLALPTLWQCYWNNKTTEMCLIGGSSITSALYAASQTTHCLPGIPSFVPHEKVFYYLSAICGMISSVYINNKYQRVIMHDSHARIPYFLSTVLQILSIVLNYTNISSLHHKYLFTGFQVVAQTCVFYATYILVQYKHSPRLGHWMRRDAVPIMDETPLSATDKISSVTDKTSSVTD